MKTPSLTLIKATPMQRGAAAVEFALVVPIFLVLLFGTFEFGRLVYLWNTVQEVSRSAARQAVVTDFTNATAIAAIKRSAVFRATDGTLPASSEISNANINIQYLNAAGTVPAAMPLDPGDNISACLDATRTDSCIRFVEVKVCTAGACGPIPFVPLVGFFSAGSGFLSTLSLSIPIPISTVRMPVESLGFSGT